MILRTGWAALAYAVLVAGFAGCGKKSVAAKGPSTVAQALNQTSGSCRPCHETQYAAWAPTDHALANRVVEPAQDAAIFATFPPEGKTAGQSAPDLILGHKPLWQPLVPMPGGRWQAHELAYDPVRQEWFNVFGAEHRQPGE